MYLYKECKTDIFFTVNLAFKILVCYNWLIMIRVLKVKRSVFSLYTKNKTS